MLESHQASTLHYPAKPFWPYSDNSCMLTHFKLSCRSQWYKTFIHLCTSLFSYSLPTGHSLSPSHERLWLAWAWEISSLSSRKPGQSHGFQAKPGHHITSIASLPWPSHPGSTQCADSLLLSRKGASLHVKEATFQERHNNRHSKQFNSGQSKAIWCSNAIWFLP